MAKGELEQPLSRLGPTGQIFLSRHLLRHSLIMVPASGIPVTSPLFFKSKVEGDRNVQIMKSTANSSTNKEARRLPDLGEASKKLQESRIAFHRGEGRECSELVRRLLGMARLRLKTGDVLRAERLIREAESHAAEIENIPAELLINLRSYHAFLCESAERGYDAIVHYRYALDVAEENDLRLRETTAVIHNNLAMLLKKMERFEEAEKHYKIALLTLEELIGAETPRVASVYNNLGVFYYSQRKWNVAIRMHNRALKLRKRIYGDDSENYDIHQSYQNLAATYKASGNYPAATVLYRQIEDREKVSPISAVVDPGEEELPKQRNGRG